MNKKKSFLIHKDSLEILDELTNEQCGELFKAIRDYQNGDELQVSAMVKIAFVPFKKQFERDEAKYQELCERNRKIAVKRHSTKSTTRNQSLPDVPVVTKSTDKDSDSDSDNKKTKAKKFTPPTIGEVRAYCHERNNNVDPEYWHDFYTSKNWMVGKNKMKDWKASVRTWERNSNNNQGLTSTSKSWKGAI